MKNYIATFFSHFGAIRFKKELGASGVDVTLMPVPRNLSSSCGTCGVFSCEAIPRISHPDELEQLLLANPDGSYTDISLPE